LVDEASRGPVRGLPTAGGRRTHAYVLSLAMSFLFSSYIARFGYGILLPRIIEEMGLSRAEAGLAYSVFTFAYSALSAVSGRLFDKYGVEVVAVLSFVYGLGLALAGESQNLSALTASLAVAGIGASSSWTPMVALVSSSLPAAWRGRAVGLLEVGIRVSHGLAGFLIPLLVSTAGLRGTWWTMSLPLFAYGFVFHVLSRSKSLRIKVEEGKGVTGYRPLLSSRAFWLVGLSYFSMSFASYIVLTFLVDFLVSELGMPYVESSAVAGVMGFAGIAGALLLPWASDVMGRATVLATGNALASLCVYLASLSSINEALAGSIGFVIATYGVLFGALWPLYAACAGDLFPSSTGTALGLWTFMMGLGALMAPIVGGFMADVSGSYAPTLQASATAYVVATMLMVATAKSWRGPRGLRQTSSATPLARPSCKRALGKRPPGLLWSSSPRSCRGLSYCPSSPRTPPPRGSPRP